MTGTGRWLGFFGGPQNDRWRGWGSSGDRFLGGPRNDKGELWILWGARGYDEGCPVTDGQGLEDAAAGLGYG